MKKLLLSLVLVFAFSSSVFAGCISGDCSNGYGTYIFSEEEWKGDKYVGEWKNDKMHGHGAYTYANGNKYVGEFNSNKRNGVGTATYISGNKYVGEYKNDDRNGNGTFTWTDGSRYVGEWKNNDMNGHGTYIYSEGGKYVGELKNDEFHGQGTYTYADGTVKSGIWKNDKFVESNESNESIESNEILIVDGKNLYYGTPEMDIVWDHYDLIEETLKLNPQINKLFLNSDGGYIGAAYAISDLIIDYEIDTHVIGSCESACTIIFLAGENRTVEKGSRLGFHQSYWLAANMKEYYLSEKSDMGWSNEFEFSEWLYSDTQAEILIDMEYLIERGVEPLFAIKTLTASSDDMWYPRRKELREAGVITE